MSEYQIKEMDPKLLNEQIEALNEKAFRSYFVSPAKLMNEEERSHRDRLSRNLGEPVQIALGAYLEDQLVGWSISKQSSGERIHTKISAVLPEHRGKGIYTKMTRELLRIAKEKGFQRVSSTHGMTNNAVLVPKLKLGFV
ncbi:MAG: GNAT family N-acetyltransferase, partial [Bdellovibrionales bacterium]|nr:GNAT family N-acetyltransferase [Bdellovibrionales bacterium]